MEHKIITYLDCKICDICGGMSENNGVNNGLTTDCRGEQLDSIMIQMIINGQADYKNGEWIRPNIVTNLSFRI